MALSVLFSDSYARVMVNDDRFFDQFYQNFFTSSAEIKRMFIHVDMENQKDMLKASLAFLLSYASSGHASRYLTTLADMHNNILHVKAEMYLCWLDALVMTVKSFDPRFSSDIDAAWRAAFMPGIEFMIGDKR